MWSLRMRDLALMSVCDIQPKLPLYRLDDSLDGATVRIAEHNVNYYEKETKTAGKASLRNVNPILL